MRSRRLVWLAALVAGCQCGFDAGKLDRLACTVSSECRPDQECIEGICTQRRCNEASECGDPAQFDCREGFCVALFGVGDGGIDAAVPCADPSQCVDGLDCTDDACEEGFCAYTVHPGMCAMDGACWQGGDVDPGNPCRVCRPTASPTSWTADDARVPNDDIDCTIDRCAGGEPVFERQDGLCGEDEICSLCAGGCAARPALTVDCPDRPGVSGGAPASCTVTASPAVGPDAGCLACETLVGVTSLVYEDFHDCSSLADLGWQGTFGDLRCSGPNELGPDLMHSERQAGFTNGRASLERWVDTTGFDSVRLCFDIASSGDDREPVAVDLDAGGGWTEIWSGGASPGGRLLWQNVCLDLGALDPLVANNAGVGVRFRAVPDLWGLDVYIDNVAIDAWVSRTITRPGRVFSDDFANCDFSEWSADAAPSCPVILLNAVAIEAAGAVPDVPAWTLSRTLDLSDRCDDIRLGFSLAARQPDGNEVFHARLDRGDGPVAFWSSVRGPIPDDAIVPFETALSTVDPLIRLAPAVTLSLDATSEGLSDMLVVDDVWLDGAECLAAEDLASSNPAVSIESGTWAVDVAATARLTAAVRCTWDGRPDVVARDFVQFCPNAECTPGEQETQSCGDCGSQHRTCQSDCRWLDWSSCADHPCSCCDEYGNNCVDCCC